MNYSLEKIKEELSECIGEFKDSDDFLDKKYKYNYDNQNFHLHLCAIIEKIEKDNKFMELKKKIKEKEIADFFEKYNQLKLEERESYEFYDEMLRKLSSDKINNEDKSNVEEIYHSICQSIIASRLKYYLTLNKKLLLIIDEIKKN